MKRVIFTGIMMLLLIFSCTTEHIDSAGTVVVTKTDLSGLTSATGTIKFSANSGSGTMADMTADASSETSLPLCSFTAPSGKKFGHWNTAADGSGYSCIDGANVKDLAAALLTAKTDNGTIVTLYAQWIDTTAPIVELAKIYTIRLDNNGGDGTMDDMTSDSGAEFALPLCSFTAPRGKKFGSWNTKADGSGIAYADKTSFTHIAKGDNEIVILYAQWIDKDAHRIIYIDPQNVTSTQIVSFKESEDVTLITPQAAIGYGFKGWYLTAVPAESDVPVIGWSAGAKTDDVMVYADWDVAVYTISYRDEGDAAFTGSTEGLPTSHTYGKRTSLVSPKRSQYSFLGWFGTSSCDGSRVHELGGEDVTSDITLFAKWEVCLECTAAELGALLASLDVTTDAYKIKITDSNPDQTVLKTALTNNSTKNVWLDLSECGEIRTINENAFKDCVSLKNISLPDSLMIIDYSAFSGCTRLTNIIIPNGVIGVYDNAFKDCINLMSISLPDSLTIIGRNTFFGCAGLYEIILPNKLQRIDEDAFKNCSGLTNLVIPNSVRFLDDYYYSILEGCSQLKSLTVPVAENDTISKLFGGEVPLSLTSITITRRLGYNPLDGCAGVENVTIGEVITEIPDNAFKNKTQLKSITLFGSVTYIGTRAFYGCSGLTNVTIPDSVTMIGYGAFSGCSGLTSIEIPNSLMSIDNNVFSDCSGLTSVKIPDSVTSIGICSFSNCRNLTKITVSNSVTTIGWQAFSLCENLTSVTICNGVKFIENGAFLGCRNLTSVTIPASVIYIENNVFERCPLTNISIDDGNTVYDSRNNCNAIIETATNTLIIGCMNTVIPTGVTSIGSNAFYGCSGLTSVKIPDSVTDIGDNAFEFCSGLTSATIGSGVISIGNSAFLYCTGLTSLTVKAINPPTFGSNMLYACSALTNIYVPADSVEAYKAADGWKDYASKITAIPTEP